MSHEIVLLESLTPKRRQSAVSGAGDGILVDSGRGREEPRDEVPIRRGRATGDDDSARLNRAESGEVGAQIADGVLALELDRITEPVPADVPRPRAPSFD